MHKNLFAHEKALIQVHSSRFKKGKTNPSGWYIEYYFLNPLSDNLERTRIKVNHLRKKLKNDRDAKAELKLYCNKINLKLAVGWSPVVDNSGVGLKQIGECIDSFPFDEEKKRLGGNQFSALFISTEHF